MRESDQYWHIKIPETKTCFFGPVYTVQTEIN